MAPLPPRDQRHLWLRYQVEGYTEEIVHDFEQRLEMIFGRQVNRVHTLDFEGLTHDMTQDLAERLRMVYTGDDGQKIFVSHAWRRIDSEMGLDFSDTFCFQLEGARRSMTWRQFILALGLHTAEEMEEDGFGAYWLGSERVIPDKGDLSSYWIEISSDRDFLRSAPSYTYIRDPIRRLCHRHAEGRKIGARLSGGHFIGHLSHHFSLVGDDWALVAQGTKRQPVAAAAALGDAEDAPNVDEGAEAIPTPIHASPLPPLATGRTMPQRLGRLEEEIQRLRQNVRSL
ncbi:hypothetical protein Tco_1459726 [Tanacetum coccineum]